MLVDIHTHKKVSETYPAVVNIALNDILNVLKSDIIGTFSVGIHPFDISLLSSQIWKKLELCMTDKRFVALGECGLDKNCNISSEIQKEIFKKQIFISEKFQKPLIIHCVGMYNELMTLRKELKPSQLWIVHGFRGKPELAQQLMKSGIKLSFGDKFNSDSIKITPIDQIFIETDVSEISLIDIYQNIAGIKHCSINDLIAGYEFYKNIT
jgi:TatD DNase family protein